MRAGRIAASALGPVANWARCGEFKRARLGTAAARREAGLHFLPSVAEAHGDGFGPKAHAPMPQATEATADSAAPPHRSDLILVDYSDVCGHRDFDFRKLSDLLEQHPEGPDLGGGRIVCRGRYAKIRDRIGA